MKNYKHILFISFMVGLGTLFHLQFFTEGFIFTISIVILHVFIYFYPFVNPIPMNLMIGIISPFIRLVSLLIDNINLSTGFNMVAPDVMFYITFGFINYWIYFKKKQKDLTYFIFSAIICDVLSNIVELSFRMSISKISIDVLRTLLLVAIIRAVIASFFILLFKSYKQFLNREEHDVRYSQLMLKTSHFKSEIYYLKKNMAQIEDTMKKAYRAYQLSQGLPLNEDLKSLSLEIAKDIHEIKKDYIYVIKGLEGFMEDEYDQNSICLKDIFSILEINTAEILKAESPDIQLKFICHEEIQISEHIYMMSILKNLIHNSIDALSHSKNPMIRLHAMRTKNNEHLLITIEDNGNGIDDDVIPYIFNPGFSTKFNTQTGDIYRGLGLSIVKSLVEERFNGSIHLESIKDKRTKMILELPIPVLKGGSQ